MSPSWPSWMHEELSTPGAGPSGSQPNYTEPLLRQDSDDVHVAQNRERPHVPQNSAARARLHIRAPRPSLPAFSLQLAPSPTHDFVTASLPILVVPPAWAFTSMPATFPTVSPPELVPAAASDVSVRTYTPFRLEPSLPTPSENPSTYVPLMERVIPTGAQISTFSELEGAVYPFAGPLVDMARVVVASRLDPRRNLEAVRRVARECLAYAGQQQPLSRARLEMRVKEETAEGSEVEVGSGDEERDESEITWSWETRCRRVAPTPTPRPMEAAGGLHPMPVVIPQTDGDALSQDKRTSTTSTHEVDNPAGEPVIEPVPLSSGGPSISRSADDQPEAQGPEDAPQPQSLPGNPIPKPTAVIDETVYGSDFLRCQPCNKQFVRASDRKRHIEMHSLPSEGLSCDWCQKGGYSRQDAIDRHKRNNCPHKARYVIKTKDKAKVEYPGSGQFWWTSRYDGDSDGDAAGSSSTVS